MQVKFEKKYEFEGKEYDCVELNMDALTGRDLLDAEKECRATGDANIILNMSLSFNIVIATKASKLPFEFFQKISIKDANKVVATVQSFLFAQD